MQNRRLGNTDLYLSEVGFGCASIWGKTFFEEEKSIELFLKAYELGINFFDTGSSYGDAEIRLGKCITKLGKTQRSKLIIATKCGTRRNSEGKAYHDWNLDWLKKSVMYSLKHLQTDYIDMLHLHGPGITDLTDEVVKTLQDMKAKGIIRAIGVNSFDTEVLEYIYKTQCFDFVMLDYNIMRQDREDLIERLYTAGIGVIAGAALAQSLYSNRIYRIKTKNDIWYLLRALKNFRGHMIYGQKFRFINKHPLYTGNQIALRYVLNNSYITSAVFGTANVEHMVENCKAVNIDLDQETLDRIRLQYRNSRKSKLDR